jgi:SulP family sulfate permease
VSRAAGRRTLRQFEPKLLDGAARRLRLARPARRPLAALTVAIVALPLAMALAIASGTAPEKGCTRRSSPAS